MEDRPCNLKAVLDRAAEARVRKTYSFEQKRNFRCNTNEFVVPEVVLRVAKKLNERDQGTPRMRTVHKEAFQENLGHNFSEAVDFDLLEEVQQK